MFFSASSCLRTQFASITVASDIQTSLLIDIMRTPFHSPLFAYKTRMQCNFAYIENQFKFCIDFSRFSDYDKKKRFDRTTKTGSFFIIFRLWLWLLLLAFSCMYVVPCGMPFVFGITHTHTHLHISYMYMMWHGNKSAGNNNVPHYAEDGCVYLMPHGGELR